MRCAALLAAGLCFFLCGCGASEAFWIQQISIVTPSQTGAPNSVAAFGDYEFVSVQGTGQIFTYNISGGSQVSVGKPYATPCSDPSGMVVATLGTQKVMAVACYDTNCLLTLTVNADGSLTALGSVGGLPMPFPGIALDGTNVLVPLFGGNSVGNGSVAKVSIATPASPLILGTATLASPVSGGVANAEYLAVAGGNIFVTSGSESNPLGASSTIQVVNEATMTLVGSPLVVPHSPQQIAVQGSVAYVTIFDATALESIDISNPANLRPLETISLATANQDCHPEPVTVQGNFVYIGCYAEGMIEQFDVSEPAYMQPAKTIAAIASPQRLAFSGDSMLVTGGASGGQVYQIDFR